SLFVGMLQSRADLLADGDDLLPGEPAAALKQGLQRLAVHELHDVKGGLAVAAGGVQTNDVRVVQFLKDFRLALEAGQGSRMGVVTAGDDLDGHDLTGLHVPAAEDRAHGAAADLVLDGERPNLLADPHVLSPGKPPQRHKSTKKTGKTL